MTLEKYVHLSLPDCRALCEEAGMRRGLRATSVEKDFWVCWTLSELFSLPVWGPQFSFKGGTSLSKAFKIIQRFSEDIDVVIEREFLGFGGDHDPAKARSRKQRSERLAELKLMCQQRVRDDLKPALEARFNMLSPNGSWQLRLATPDEDRDQQTLMFHYPSAFGGEHSYAMPWVKIELGARSDTEPFERPTMQPYLAEEFPDVLGPCLFSARTVAAHRTFWEKAMLLHEETFRPADKARKRGLARHYYDLSCLITQGIGQRAVDTPQLFERCAEHRPLFFRNNWVDYTTLCRGSLRLVPSPDQLTYWREDYLAMKEEMFFGPVPEFDKVLEVVGGFERSFNAGM